jgi:hypothetical protein
MMSAPIGTSPQEETNQIPSLRVEAQIFGTLKDTNGNRPPGSNSEDTQAPTLKETDLGRGDPRCCSPVVYCHLCPSGCQRSGLPRGGRESGLFPLAARFRLAQTSLAYFRCVELLDMIHEARDGPLRPRELAWEGHSVLWALQSAVSVVLNIPKPPSLKDPGWLQTRAYALLRAQGTQKAIDLDLTRRLQHWLKPHTFPAHSSGDHSDL